MDIKPHSNGILYAHFKDSDQKHKRVSLGTRNKKEARQIAKEMRIEDTETMARLGFKQNEILNKITNQNISCQDAVDHWKKEMRLKGLSNGTIYKNSITVEQLIREKANGKQLSSLNREHVYDFINQDDNFTETTKKRKLSSIKTFFDFCVGFGYVSWNFVQDISVNRKILSFPQKEVNHIQPFTEKEISTMLEKSKDLTDKMKFAYYFVRIGLATGLRIGDVAQLEWNSIVDGHLIVFTEKRDSRVLLPIDEKWSPGLRQVLSEIPNSGTPYMFPELKELCKDVKLRSRNSVYFGRFLKMCGINGKSFHSFRSYCFSKWKAQGKSLDQLREATGHKSNAIELYINHEIKAS